MSAALIPAWVRLWHLFNLIALIPDWLYMELRPRTVVGGDLAWMFPISNLYAKIDKLLYVSEDKTVRILYNLGAFDIVLCCCLYLLFNAHVKKVSFAIFVICRAIFAATRTTLYVMYSREFVVRGWYGIVLVLNGAWLVVPLLVVVQVCGRLADGIKYGITPANIVQRHKYYASI